MEIYRPEDAFRMNVWTLTLYGAWPFAVKHPVLRYIYKLYGYGLLIFYLTIITPPEFINLYMMRSSIDKLIDSSWVTLTCMGYIPKILLIIFRGKKLEELFKRLQNPVFAPRKKEHLLVLHKHSLIAKKTSFTFATMCMVTIMIWVISPLLVKKQGLLVSAWYPYDTSINPAYGYTYASQAFLLIYTASINSMIDTMITNFYVVMGGQIEILKLDFKQLADIVVIKSLSDRNHEFPKEILISGKKLFSEVEKEEGRIPKETFHSDHREQLSSDKNFQGEDTNKHVFYTEKSLDRLLNERVMNCAEHYKEILRFVNDITNFFEIGIVFQVCASMIVICTTTYKMTLISPTTLQFHIVMQYQICMLIQIFLYTWRGNDFTIKATELKDAVYECAWMTVPNKKFRKSLCIIMSPLHIPVKLVVGKFFALSVDTFFRIIKTAYTFYVLLKQINDKRM